MIAGAAIVLNACRQHFYGSDAAGIGLEKQHDAIIISVMHFSEIYLTMIQNLSPVPVPTQPGSLGEARDLTFADGPVPAYDGFAYVSSFQDCSHLF
jgi:hypothetical protein